MMQGDNRLGYVDALRGFSMFLVVLAHVMLAAGCGDNHTVLSTILITFRMPLFFFISGYFACREAGFWTKRRVADTLRRKVCAQIIGMVVFLSVYCYCMNLKLFSADGWGFGGYWFTVSLFQMFLVYLVSCFVFRCKSVVAVLILSVVLFSLQFAFRIVPDTPVCNYLFVSNTVTYLPAFALGLAARAFRPQFVRLIADKWFITISIVLFVVASMLIYDRGLHTRYPALYLVNRKVLVRLAGLAAVVSLFYSLRGSLGGDAPYARWLRYAGTRTLDIYYLHYFFIPALPQVVPFFRSGGKTIVIILVLGAIAAAIIAISLLLGRWIRTSLPLSRLLFGTK